jgi:hypothetical protein
MQAPPQEDALHKELLNVGNLKNNVDAINYMYVCYCKLSLVCDLQYFTGALMPMPLNRKCWQLIVIWLPFPICLVFRRRILASTLAGCTAGILGLTNLYGFLFYFLASAFVSGLLFLKARGKVRDCAVSPLDLLWNGTMGNLLGYIFWWTYVLDASLSRTVLGVVWAI